MPFSLYTNVSLQNVPKIEKSPLIGREKWQEAQNKAISGTFIQLEDVIVRKINGGAEKHLKAIRKERNQAEENAQLRGVIREHGRKLLPEKKQEIKPKKSQGGIPSLSYLKGHQFGYRLGLISFEPNIHRNRNKNWYFCPITFSRFPLMIF